MTKLTMPERGLFGLFGVWEATHVINGKALSKACIHKENELKTCPMELGQYIYREIGSY